MGKIIVLLADDHTVMREGLRQVFYWKQILTRRVSPYRVGLMIGWQLPTPTKRAVKLHDREQLVELKLHEHFLGWKQQLLLLQNLIIIRVARTIALQRDLHGYFVGFNGTTLLRVRGGRFFTRNQRIGNFLKGIQHAGLILQ